MSYSSFLIPRREVISDEGVEGIIDLANLTETNKTKLEANPENFFDLTYPTSDVRKVVDKLHRRFSTSGDIPGLFLFEGLKGSGKSHLLLLIYNLFKHSKSAQKWLTRHNLKCEFTNDVVVVVNKFTDNSSYSIWNIIFQQLGFKYEPTKPVPSLSEFQQALGKRTIVLIFDELEQGIRVIDNPAAKAQNISFLQMLSEFSTRSTQITLFASIYSDREEPGSTLKRVPCTRIQFSDSAYNDKSNVILHRLFENVLSFDKRNIQSVVEGYINTWSRHIDFDADKLRQDFSVTYPFTPFLMDIILKKVPARGGFQNVRGALGFLANLVKLTYKDKDIISAADSSLLDQENTTRLSDLDTRGDLIRKAKENLNDLEKYPYANSIASAVLLSTLADNMTKTGIGHDNLIQEVLTPERDINNLGQTLMAFQKYASFFHYNPQEQRYYFDLEENSEAKIEFASLKISDEAARQELSDTYQKDVFKESSNSVVFRDISSTQEQLNQLDKKRLRYVLTTRRLSQEERHKVYFGLDCRNIVILLEPKDDNFQLASNNDLLKWAKRYIAAQKLVDATTDSSRKSEYSRIGREDKNNIVNAIKRAGLVLVCWVVYGQNVSDDETETEPIGGDCSKDKVLEALTQDYFPVIQFKEHLEERIDEIKDKLVKEVDAEYRATLGFPVPALATSVSNAIRKLCGDGVIGLQHTKGNYCGVPPLLNEQEIVDAKITASFGQKVTDCPKCGKTPCICKKPPRTTACSKCGQLPCICYMKPLEAELCKKCGKMPCACQTYQTKTIAITSQLNTNSLRQQTALRLQQETDFVATKISYKVYLEKSNVGDLSKFPASLRGSLSGQGDIIAEITIVKTGEFSKSQIEQQIEALPSMSDAEYKAELVLKVKAKE